LKLPETNFHTRNSLCNNCCLSCNRFLDWIYGWLTAVHPGDGSIIQVKNLLNGDGLRWIYENVVHNFVNFPPLGYVLAVMIGIGVAEGSGLFNTVIRALVLKAPQKLITGSVVFAGVLSHLASEAGYVILIPLGAMIFYAIGRHPMAGLAAAFAESVVVLVQLPCWFNRSGACRTFRISRTNY